MEITLTWEEETDDRERDLHGTRWYLNAGSIHLGTIYQRAVNIPYSPPHLWKRWEARIRNGGHAGDYVTEEEAKNALLKRIVQELTSPHQ